MNEISLDIFIFLSIITGLLFLISLTGHSKLTIITTMLTTVLSYSLSKLCINSKIVQYFSDISSTDTIVIETQTIVLFEFHYIYLFMAIISVFVLIIYIIQEIQYNMKNEIEGIDYDF